MAGYTLLLSKDPLTDRVRAKGIASWEQLLRYVQILPYGRNANRDDLSLVLSEEKGSCSSKHAFLKTMADLNGVADVELILGIYAMRASNTPAVGPVLLKHQLDSIPEAHCYLLMEGKRIDFTHAESDIKLLENDILVEQAISPNQVSTYKVEYHQAFLSNWLENTASPLSFEALWTAREECLAALALWNPKG